MGAAVCAFAGCQDELDQNKVKGGDYVPFAISEDKTRTAYDGTDAWQINWVEGDKVRVFCYEAEDVNNAEYSVTKVSDEKTLPNKEGKLAPNGSGLKWGGTDNEHKFYAVYPSDASKCSVSESGIATIKMNLNQTATIGSLNDTVHSTTPDMSNAFMVAYATGKASETTETNPIKLAFKPIMTTLEITVQGKADNYSPVTLTGISLSMEVPTEVASTGSFQYDIAKQRLVTDNAGSASSSTSTTTETIFVNLVTTENTTNALTLTGGQSVKITAFLPPVPVNGDNKVKVRVHATGAEGLTVTLGKAKDDGTANIEIGASEKATNITLPKIPAEQKGNNWITPLDDNIYVQQLSIPGVHDAAAYSTSLLDAGQTQTKNINEQLAMGIRAFDLRPAYRKYRSEMWLYHGATICDITLNNALTYITTYLNNNPGEFVFIQLRHENETSLQIKDTDKWGEIYNELKKFDDKIVQWEPDLTIGECRGKMIIVTRNDYTNRTKVALVASFPDNTSGKATLNGNTTYYVQDYYKYTLVFSGDDADGKKKISLIKSLIETTNKFCDKTSEDFINKSWALNHTSGYCGQVLGTGTTTQYQHNASLVNPEIYNYLQSQTTHGPLGIVFMDYVGERTASSYTVYGDLLPQAIIDNNYKYRMLRKGE